MKLSQYRAAAGGEAGGDKEQEQIARALLSNTDKEIIFDGLKKLYRKKVRKNKRHLLAASMYFVLALPSARTVGRGYICDDPALKETERLPDTESVVPLILFTTVAGVTTFLLFCLAAD